MDIYKSCKKCGIRIGCHSVWESLRCGLITKEEAREAFRAIPPNTEKIELNNNNTTSIEND